MKKTSGITRSSTNFSLKLVVLLIFILKISVIAQTNNTIEKRISNLLNSEVELDSLKTIIKDIIHESDTAYLRKKLDIIIKKTSEDKNSKSYVFSLIAYGQFKTKNTIPFLNKAYKIAKKNDYSGLLAHIVDTRGNIYEANGNYDSLIISLMEAKEIFENRGNLPELVTILHLTADLYFRLKLYDKAEKLYLEILAKKGDLTEWEFWRNVVILNNLGLIDLRQNKYDRALQYFEKSLDVIKNDSLSPRYTIALGYNQLQFANCYLKMGKDSLAFFFNNKGLKNCSENKMYEEIIQLYNNKSELFFNAGQIDSSLFYAKKSLAMFRENKFSKQGLIPIYFSLYKVYRKLKDYKMANNYLNLYTQLKDSLNSVSQTARYLQIMAENDYEKTTAKMDLLEEKYFYLFIIAAAFLIFLTITYINYFKLKTVYKKLVNKNLEIVSVEDNSLKVTNKNGALNNNGIVLQHATFEQKELIKNLKAYMQKEKAFLKKEISIKEVAQKLNSNRTYLSRAINLSLKQNFATYINELRIKEAIRGISSGKFKEITIEGISAEVGFNNRVSFNTAFKKYTGVLPSYFIVEVSKKMR